MNSVFGISTDSFNHTKFAIATKLILHKNYFLRSVKGN